MNEILNSPINKLIVQTLLHSLWQAGLAYLLYKIILSLLPKLSSEVRYSLGLMTLVVLLLSNIATLSLLLSYGNQTAQLITPLSNLSIMELAPTGFSKAVNGLPLLDSYIPAFIIFWWMGLLFFTIRFAVSVYRTKQLTRTGLIAPPERIMEIFRTLKTRLAMSEKISIALSEKILTPIVAGVIKPIILLPIGLVNSLSIAEVEAILIHEFTHIRRHDFLVNILQTLVEMVYFFNPFVWLISSEIREERENICDDKALAMGISRRAYADTLANVYEYACNNNYAMAFANKKKLTLKRIKRIMKTQSNNNRLFSSLALVLVITLAIFLGAESRTPSEKFPFSTPERIILASPLSALEFADPGELILSLKQKINNEFGLMEPVSQPDTIDEKAQERKAREYEQAVERLQSTDEWQELELIRKEMLKEKMQYMKKLKPQLEETLREAKMSLMLDEVELEEVKERMAQIESKLQEIEFEEEIERALEYSAQAMQESLAQVEAQIERAKNSEFEHLARIYAIEAEAQAKEAEAQAKEAEMAASEALKEARNIENFLVELKPQLVKDGYLKSKDDLDNLLFEDGKVFVNDKEVKSKDAKKYYQLRQKHLGTDTMFFMN